MRVSPRLGTPEVSPMPEANSNRIRMHIAGTTYRMEPDEAIKLANDLADACEQLIIAEVNLYSRPEQREPDKDEEHDVHDD